MGTIFNDFKVASSSLSVKKDNGYSVTSQFKEFVSDVNLQNWNQDNDQI